MINVSCKPYVSEDRETVDMILIDEKTGEIIGEYPNSVRLVEIYEGDRVVRNNSKKYFKKPSGKTIKINSSFIKINEEELIKIKDKLTANEKILLLELLVYIGYTDGVLKTRNGTYLNNKMIKEKIKLSSSSIDKAIKGLIDKKILTKEKRGRDIVYYMNPYLARKGTNFDKKLLDMFKTNFS